MSNEQEQLELIINLPGGVPRLPIHIGALKAWHDLGFPRPNQIIGSSAGAIAGSSIIGWNDTEFNEAINVIGELTPDQIFSYRRGLKLKLAALGVSTLGLGTLVLLDHKLSRGNKAILGLAGLATLLATDAMVGNELIHSTSHLSPEPLRNLLRKKLNYNSIFNSKIELRVIIADISKPGEVVFSNHNPLNSDPYDQIHRERWINILLASARLPGKFPFIKIGGIDTIDGEVWTDFPIRQMKIYKKIFRFDYWPPLNPEQAPKEWITDLTRSFDIMRDRCTQKKMEYYELERQNDPLLPEIYYIRLDPELMRELPHIKLHDFNPEQMKIMENIGYLGIKKQFSSIKRYLEA